MECSRIFDGIFHGCFMDFPGMFHGLHPCLLNLNIPQQLELISRSVLVGSSICSDGRTVL